MEQMHASLAAVSLMLGLASAVCLFIGSQRYPAELETWKCNSPPERQFKRRRTIFVVAGFVLLIVSVAGQLVP